MGLASYDCGGSVSVERQTIQRARKEYCCGECGEVIAVGDRYRRDFQVVDGCGDTNFMCMDCDDLSKRFFKAAQGLDLTFFYGDLRGAIRDLYHEFNRTVDGHDYPPTVVSTSDVKEASDD